MVYALVPLDATTPRARLVQLATAVVERARAGLSIELTGAVGATVGGLHEVTRSRNDVDAVAIWHEWMDRWPTPAHLAAAPHLRLPAVEKLLAQDLEHGTPYAESVLAYLAANADIPVAAASVKVHPNTFRYRLRRVKELFDLDLEDPDVRLITWLQLRTRS